MQQLYPEQCKTCILRNEHWQPFALWTAHIIPGEVIAGFTPSVTKAGLCAPCFYKNIYNSKLVCTNLAMVHTRCSYLELYKAGGSVHIQCLGRKNAAVGVGVGAGEGKVCTIPVFQGWQGTPAAFCIILRETCSAKQKAIDHSSWKYAI